MSNISPCDAEVKSRECTHLWKIENYSTVTQKQRGKLKSIKFSAADDDLNWCLEHTLYMKSINETYVSFSLRPDCYDDLKRCESVSGNGTIYLMNDRRSLYCGITYTFTLSYDEKKLNCKVARYNSNTIKDYLCHDALEVICKLTYRKKKENVTSSSSSNSNAVRISEYRFSTDMERCFTEDRFKDLTISVKGKEYRVHKNILATRSTVFDKMLTVDMLESKKNHIDITDVDHEPFEEMLHYIYTGKVKNLEESAFELLPLADKYDLKELMSMCEEVLVKKLTTGNAAMILILADTHRAGELKARTLRFITENYESCDEFNDTEVWKSLSAHNFQLLKELMTTFCKRQKLD